MTVKIDAGLSDAARTGEEVVRSRVRVEPSGDAFSELSLAPETGAPRNPLINAGAIACVGLVASVFAARRTARPFAPRRRGRQSSSSRASSASVRAKRLPAPSRSLQTGPSSS